MGNKQQSVQKESPLELQLKRYEPTNLYNLTFDDKSGRCYFIHCDLLFFFDLTSKDFVASVYLQSLSEEDIGEEMEFRLKRIADKLHNKKESDFQIAWCESKNKVLMKRHYKLDYLDEENLKKFEKNMDIFCQVALSVKSMVATMYAKMNDDTKGSQRKLMVRAGRAA